MSRTNFTTPVGRFVQGNVHTPRTQDFDGKPLLIKTGPNAGKPTQQFFIAIAIRKGAEQHWAYTEWGKIIWAVGCAAFPQHAQAPTFAWKVTDGDSQVPNKRGKKPADQEGFRGHWVLKFASQFPPKCYNSNGSAPLDPQAIKTGYFIQVNGDVDGNGNANNAGVFLNASMVAMAAYGDEIVQGPDVASAGFGQGVQLPPGATMQPPPAFTAPVPAGAPMQPAMPGAGAPLMPPVPAAGSPLPPAAISVQPPATGAPPVSPSSVPPNPAFTQVPGQPPAPPAPAMVAPPPPPAPVVHQMTAAAQGCTYEQFVAQGWSDAQMRQQGMML